MRTADAGERPLVVFDVDEVLVNLRDPMAEALNALTGRSLTWHEWTCYDLTEVYGVPLSACLDALRAHRVLERCWLEPHAKACVARARALGYATAAVTARGWHPHGRALTERLFTEHEVAIDHLRVVDLGQSKREALSTLPGPVVYLIEDNLAHLREAERAGIPVAVLVDRPWNASGAARFRVGDLAQFATMLVPPSEVAGAYG